MRAFPSFKLPGLVLALLGAASIGQAQLASGPWPKFQGGNGNLGIGPCQGAVNSLKWSHNPAVEQLGTINASTVVSSPVIGPDGTMYIGCDNGLVYAFDGSDGVIKWKFSTGGPVATAPALGANGLLYFGSFDGNVYAVNHSTGVLSWSFKTGGLVESSPAIGANGDVYVSSTDGYLYALNSIGKVQWSYNLGSLGTPTLNCPAIGKNGLVFVTTDFAQLAAIDGTTGELVWALDAEPGSTLTSPVIGPDGTLYLGESNGEFEAMDPATGDPKWGIMAGGAVDGPTVSSNGTIYFGCQDGNLYALKSNGVLLWKYAGTSPFTSSAILGLDDTLYVGDFAGNLNAINGDTGVLNWSHNLGGPVFGSPAMGSDGSIYVGSYVSKAPAIFSFLGTLSVTTQPINIAGGLTSRGVITLGSPAPKGGAVVALSAGSSLISIPPTVTVPAGLRTATFTIATQAVQTATPALITASYTNAKSMTTLMLEPLLHIQLSPSSTPGGYNLTGSVLIYPAAAAGGATVSLVGSGPITCPTSVTVPAGSNLANFTVQTTPVASTVTATVTGTLSSVSSTGSATILPPQLHQIVYYPVETIGGMSATGEVNLVGLAPPQGLTINLSGNSICSVPATVVVPAGQDYATFKVNTVQISAPGHAVVTASYQGKSVSGSLALDPDQLASLTVSPTSVTEGSGSTGTITLVAPAPGSGVVVSLISNDAGVTVPATVTIAAGQKTGTFKIGTSLNESSGSATITATLFDTTKSASLGLSGPNFLQDLILYPTETFAGEVTTGTVELTGAAPTGGVLVLLTSNAAAGDLTFPSSINITAGGLNDNFTVFVNNSAKGKTFTITATDVFGHSVSATFSVHS